MSTLHPVPLSAQRNPSCHALPHDCHVHAGLTTPDAAMNGSANRTSDSPFQAVHTRDDRNTECPSTAGLSLSSATLRSTSSFARSYAAFYLSGFGASIFAFSAARSQSKRCSFLTHAAHHSPNTITSLLSLRNLAAIDHTIRVRTICKSLRRTPQSSPSRRQSAASRTTMHQSQPSTPLSPQLETPVAPIPLPPHGSFGRDLLRRRIQPFLSATAS